MIQTITTYCSIINHETASTVEKIKCITETEKQLNDYKEIAHDKGFSLHVLKKFHFDVQQQLQKLIPSSELYASLNEAFCAALKLDRISEFHAVVLEAIKLNKLNTPSFTEFLEKCIYKGNCATNYIEAEQESAALSKAAKKVIRQLNSITTVIQLLLTQAQYDGLKQGEQINASDLEEEEDYYRMVDNALPAISTLGTLERAQQEQITVLSC
ncbi:MAG: hypothetical protein ACRCXC_05825 [Legionella sp.]